MRRKICKKISGKTKTRRTDGSRTPTRRHVGSSEFGVFSCFVMLYYLENDRRDRVFMGRGRHALGRAWRARRFKRRRFRFRFQQFFAFYQLVLRHHHRRRIHGLLVHIFFKLEIEIYTYIYVVLHLDFILTLC